MRSRLRAILVAVLLLVPVPPGMTATLTPYKATYDLYYGGVYAGVAFYELEIDVDGNIQFNARVEPRGVAAWISSDIVSEQSRLRLDGDGSLIAQHYEYKQVRNQVPVEQKSVEFDWPAGLARTRINDDHRQVAIEPGTVDRMSLQLKLMLDRLAGNDGKEIVYPIVEDHEIREYRFEVTGQERIATEAGRYDTVRLERRHKDRTTIFWSAPSLGYLPVRVEQQRTNRPTSQMDLSTINMRRTLPPR